MLIEIQARNTRGICLHFIIVILLLYLSVVVTDSAILHSQAPLGEKRPLPLHSVNVIVSIQLFRYYLAS